MRRLLEDRTTHYWVGLTDIEDDAKWNLLDGESYDPSDTWKQALYYCNPGYSQPNYGRNELCVFVFFHKTTYSYGLGNWYCKDNIFESNPIKGLCEICDD